LTGLSLLILLLAQNLFSHIMASGFYNLAELVFFEDLFISLLFLLFFLFAPSPLALAGSNAFSALRKPALRFP